MKGDPPSREARVDGCNPPGEELVSAGTFSDRMQAELARSRLEAAGLRSVVSADDCGGELPLSSSVRLLVRPHDLQPAREILAAGEPG